MKKTISLIGAAAVIALMAGLLIWQRNREPEEEYTAPPPATSTALIQRTENELASVVFQTGDETIYMLPLTDEDDRVVAWHWEGMDYAFNESNLRNKVRGAFSLFANQVIHEDIADVPDLNLADFGLADPEKIITANFTDGTSYTIYLGVPTGDFRSYFVRVSGNPGLFTIASLVADRFNLGLEDLLELNLPFWDADSLDYVYLARYGEETIEFTRVDHDVHEGLSWVIMQEPFYGREVFLTALTTHVFEPLAPFSLGDMVNLHAENLAPYGLDTPSMEFIYRAPHGEAHLLFGDIFFREIDGQDEGFIYVKFADRPHVFEVMLEHARPLLEANPLRFVDRFVALVNIQDIDAFNIITGDTVYEIVINHVPDTPQDIEPTINGQEVDVREFRIAYRLLIALGMDAEIEPITPTGQPVYTVRYSMIDEDDLELRFFEYDLNFFAVSVNGEDAWFVTSQMGLATFFMHVRNLL